MIVLDTNVVSELLRPEPDRAVFRWAAKHDPLTLFTTCITQAEILAGIAILPAGSRRDRLAETAEMMFRIEFANRLLPLGEAAASRFAGLVAARRSAGRPLAAFDGLIAATATVAGAAVATRDTGGFTGCGLTLIDPWTGAVTT